MTSPVSIVNAQVLVADGDVLVRNALAEYLRKCGYLVVEAANSDEAVTVVKEPSLGIDVLLADASLTGTLSGFGLGRWVRENAPAVEVVLAAGVNAAANAAAEICDQAPEFTRPYDPQLVVERIKQLRAQRERHAA